MTKNLIMNVQYCSVNGLKLAKDAFAVSTNANLDGKKALEITSHPNIPTPSCCTCDIMYIVIQHWLSPISGHPVILCFYVGNPWPLHSGLFNLFDAILSDMNSVRRNDRRLACFGIVLVSFVACAVVLQVRNDQIVGHILLWVLEIYFALLKQVTCMNCQ